MKGLIGSQMRLKHLMVGTPLYNKHIVKDILSTIEFSKSQQAQFKLKVIQFQKQYGIEAAVDAFGISRRSIYRWKKKLKESGGKLTSLIPDSREPRRKRKMMTDWRIISFIRKIRKKRGRIGKEKIKPLLDEYCRQSNLKSISISTIGKIIKRYNLFYYIKGRYYHNPASKWTQRKVRYKEKVKKSPKVDSPGYLQIDTIVGFIYGIKIYILNAVDVNTRFQFSLAYMRLNSKASLKFFKRLELVYPLGNIHTVQTDNGSEFEGELDRYLKEKGIRHLYSYPRCPKVNAYVERSNRTLQEEFVDLKEDSILISLGEFNRKLMDYLIWYNTKRVHKGLGNISPMDYILKNYPQKCYMYGTYTSSCNLIEF